MHKYKGGIIAHIGPMFGGKTSGLLADVRKMTIAGYKVSLFKPRKDDRYSENKVVNHDGESIEAINVVTFEDIIKYVDEHPEVNVIAIDEFQFIQKVTAEEITKISKLESSDMLEKLDSLIDAEKFIKWIMDNNKTLIISGLDLDSNLNPFSNVKELLPYATHIFKHKAVCVCCGTDATTSYCKVEKGTVELLGGKDIYEPRCLSCYKKGNQ